MNISAKGPIYLDRFVIDLERRVVLEGGEPLSLNPKAFDLLLALIDSAGEVVSKEDLLDRVWPGQFVEENNLTVHISSLRKLLGEKKQDHRYIITVPGRGYKFIGELRYGDSAALSAGEDVRDDAGNGLKGKSVETPSSRRSPRKLALLAAAAVFLTGFIALLIWRQAESAPQSVTRNLAILPFKPLVEENRDEALEFGMSDSLISGFSRIRTINVRPITAVRRYTALDQDAREAGRELGVESVLDGSIQRTGERLRISTRLIRVADGATLWAETFDEDFTDIFAVQDSISQKIIRALAVELSGEESRDLAKKHTQNAEAYSLYVKGRYFWSRITPDDLSKSLDLYRQAIAIDPTYAMAYAGIADSYNLLGSYGFLPLKESHPKAKAAAEKALELDEELAEAHASLAAVIADYYWDWAEAERHFKRAVELNPNYLVARTWYSQHLARMGRLGESIEEARQAQKIDPISASATSHLGLALYRSRRFDEAVAELNEALQLNPRSLDAHLFLAFVNLQQGKGNEAIERAQAAVELSGGNAGMVAILGYVSAAAGKRGEAEAVLERLMASDKARYPLETALIYMALGDQDTAFEWLEVAYRERSWQLGFLAVEPLFDPLRGDPQFSDLLRRLGLSFALDTPRLVPTTRLKWEKAVILYKSHGFQRVAPISHSIMTSPHVNRTRLIAALPPRCVVPNLRPFR